MNIANSIELYDNASATLSSIYYGSLSVVDGFDSVSNSIRNIPDVNVSWDSIDISDKFQQQVQRIASGADEIYELQNEISNRAYDMEILPANAINDIANVSDRISILSNQVKALETIDISGRSDEEIEFINNQLQRSRTQLDSILAVQQSINNAISDNNIEAINAGFIRLNDLADNLENTVERTMSIESNVEPVEIPVEWVSNSDPPVFTTTGIERYEQEIANANSLMDNLLNTQANINASAVDVLSPTAISDLSNINTRIGAIQQRIQQIEDNPLNMGSDAANAGIENLRGQLSQALQAQVQLNSAIDNMDVSAANAAYARLSSTVSNTERYIRDNVTEQGAFNEEIAQGTNDANELMGKIKGAVGAYLSLKGIGETLSFSDQMVQTTARLDLIVDDGNSVDELESKIRASAKRARGSYQTTADAVSKLGMQAADAFTTNDELIAFTELLNKQFVIAGTSAQGVDSVMLQLTQSMAAGKLQGEELNAVLDNAQPIVAGIKKYLEDVQGVDASNIKELASDGVITADIIKNAMFYMADDINTKFAEMPVTWSQLWIGFKDDVLNAFQPVLQQINALASSGVFQGFVEGAITTMFVLANVVLDIFDIIGSIGGFIAEHWNVIGPIVKGVAAALGVYYGWLLLIKAIEIISTGVKIALCIASFARAAATGAEATATATATAAQYGLNTAILACPIFWIILLIIALIAILVALCNWIADTTGIAESGIGIICGALAMAGAFIWNLIVGLINSIIQFLWTMFVEPFIGIIEFILNVCNGGFDSFGDAVANLIGQIISWFLSLGKVVTKIIDAIFGTDWTAGLNSLQDSVLAWGKNENAITLSREAPEVLQRIEYGAAWDAGSEFGDNVSASVSGFFDDAFNPATDAGEDALNGLDTSSFGKSDSDLKNSSDKTAKNTKKIADNTKKSDDILSMIKDSLSRERIANYTTKQVTVDMSGMSNQIASSLSIGDVVKAMEKEIARGAAAAVEGV